MGILNKPFQDPYKPMRISWFMSLVGFVAVAQVTELKPRSGNGLAKISVEATDTPRTTNISPENQWLEDVFPFEIFPF